ncbi:hypothetical protein [Neisseria sp. CCUG12390]|uniref:hypothetical protein n=1 Tax=Neisseria sp. CCUG12390 TaxID=3392035 RepID=UPI003A0FC887
MLKYSEVVETIIVEPVFLDSNELNFKIEILKNSAEMFKVRLFRLELYRVKPSFIKEMVADEAQYVLDTHTLPDIETVQHCSEERCLNEVLNSGEIFLNLPYKKPSENQL